MPAIMSLKELAAFRKSVQKADLETLLESDLLHRAIEVVSSPHADELTLDILSLHLSLYRQLRFMFESESRAQHIVDLTHDRLAAALVPGQPCADLLISCLESSVRTRSLRSSDALSALGRMVDVLPPPSASASNVASPLEPVFHHAASAKDLGRTEMVLLNALLPHVPSTAIPPTLRQKLLDDMDNLDCASQRSNILVQVLLRSTEEGTEDWQRDQAILEPILPLCVKEDSTTLLNMTRYLLPSLFTARPSTIQALLNILAETRGEPAFSAWISIASLGVSSGFLNISDLPARDLHAAVSHSDPSVQLRAFQLLIGTKNPRTPDRMALVKSSMMANAVLPSAGARSEFVSSVYAFFKKLRELHESGKSTLSESRVFADFEIWLLHTYVDQGLLTACRYPVVKAILALNVLRSYLDVFGHQQAVQQAVYTPERVSALLVCQASEFAEVRSRARAILERTTTSLPILAAPSSPAAAALRASALDSLNHPRNTQAEAGKSVLCIMFQRSTTSAGLEDLRLLGDLVTRLEVHVAASEKSVIKGLEEHPLHGILAAISDVVHCIKLKDIEAERAWMPLFERLTGLVDRVWAITRPVISLAPSKTADAEKPDHEIARAYEVLGGEGEEDEEAMDHTNLLSGSWRATKEAGELLAALIRLPLAQLEGDQTIWSPQQINEAGRRFLTWMHEIRHRGTFSKIAVAFTDLVDAVKGVESLKHLCHSWLQDELNIITTDSLSTTRRSAALPYSVLAIVANNVALLDQAFDALNDLARVDNTSSSDVTKVHAFNILKIVLLDARQSKLLDRYFERAVMTALHAFASPNWNVRNVGLILFSTIVHRSLAPGRGTQDYYASKTTLASRQTLWNWHQKYPTIIPYVKQILESTEITSPNAHSPLFPILIILRSLRWSPPGAKLATELAGLVERFLSSKEWQVRAVAAQALSSMLSPEAALERLATLTWPETIDNNELHGQLSCLGFVVGGAIDWSRVESRKASDEKIVEIASQTPKDASPLINKAVLDLGTAYVATSGSTSQAVRKNLVDLARSACVGSSQMPGMSLLQSTAAEVILRYSTDPTNVSTLIRSPVEETCLAAIAAISSRHDHDPSSALKDLVHITISDKQGLACRIAALEAIADMEMSTESAILDGKTFGRLDEVIRRDALSRCVPLREAATAVSGLLLAWSIKRNSTSELTSRLAAFVSAIDKASDINQSQPSRRSAVSALAALTPFLYPSTPTTYTPPLEATVELHRLVLRLLQDDEEGIRQSAAEIVQRGLGLPRGICQSKAMELEWAHIREAYKRQAGAWAKMIHGSLLDDENFDADLKRMRPRGNSSDVLFEVEPPNLFRDPMVDLRHATEVAKSGEGSSEALVNALKERITRAEREIEGLTEGEQAGGLIDGRFDARRRVEARLGVWRGVGGRANDHL